MGPEDQEAYDIHGECAAEIDALTAEVERLSSALRVLAEENDKRAAERELSKAFDLPPMCGPVTGGLPVDPPPAPGTHYEMGITPASPPAPLFGVPVEVATRARTAILTGMYSPSAYATSAAELTDAIRTAESREVPGWLRELIEAGQCILDLREYGITDRFTRLVDALKAARAALGIK